MTTVDLFATRLNKVEAFFSRLLDPIALLGNPLQVDWFKGLLYMFPPLPLLSLALHTGDLGGGSGHCDSTMVALKRIASPGPSTLNGLASVITRSRQSSPQSGWDAVPQPPGSPPSRLETLRRSLRRQDLLREAAGTICAGHNSSM